MKRRGYGFTIVELLVILSIIAILASLALFGLRTARGKARDTQRIADISGLAKAANMYYDDHKESFPESYGWIKLGEGTAVDTGFQKYISKLPLDPSKKNYQYRSDGKTYFEVCADLEGRPGYVYCYTQKEKNEGGHTDKKVERIYSLRIDGPIAGERFGNAVTGFGNNILIGAYRASSDNGKVYVYDSDGNQVRSISGVGSFGKSISTLGDSYFVVGAPYADYHGTNSGSVFIYDSNFQLVRRIDGENANEWFGYSVAGVGSNRIVVGSPEADCLVNNGGCVNVYNIDGTLIKSINGADANGQLGISVAAYDSDKFIVGADGANKVFIYSSNGTLLSSYHEDLDAIDGSFGFSVASNGSRYIVGAYNNSPDVGGQTLWGRGSSYIFNSSGGKITLNGEKSYDFFGIQVSHVGKNFLVGANSTPSGGNWGTVYLYSPYGSLVRKFGGEKQGDLLGNAVGSMKDQDGDGNEEILMGATGTDPDGRTDAGSVYLYFSYGKEKK